MKAGRNFWICSSILIVSACLPYSALSQPVRSISNSISDMLNLNRLFFLVQQIPKDTESRLVLASNADIDLKVNVRPKGGTWSTYVILSGEKKTISCDRCRTDSFELVIRTGDVSVNYTLKPFERYAIIWNGKRQIWDVTHVEVPD